MTSPPPSSEGDPGPDDALDDGLDPGPGDALWLGTTDDESVGVRLDVWLARATGESRSRLSALIGDGAVRVDGDDSIRPSLRLEAGQAVSVEFPPAAPVDAAPEDIPLDVVYEDEHVVVVNKAPGMVVHPAPGHPGGTLVNALLHHCAGLSSVGGIARQGIVHRIDRDTSGLIVATRTDAAHRHLAAQFAAHTVDREYLALCVRLGGDGLAARGRIVTGHARSLDDRRRFTGRLGGRSAITNYEIRERFGDGAMLVACRLETGRTHQIRMHLTERGCPLLGDPLYGGNVASRSPLIRRTALHALTLGFTLPDGRRVSFEAPLPPDFRGAVEALRAGRSWRP